MTASSQRNTLLLVTSVCMEQLQEKHSSAVKQESDSVSETLELLQLLKALVIMVVNT